MDHGCRDHLEYHQKYRSENLDPEVDGAIEHWWDEWWECTICSEKFTAEELPGMGTGVEEKEESDDTDDGEPDPTWADSAADTHDAPARR